MKADKTVVVASGLIAAGLAAWFLLAEKKAPEPSEFRHVESPPATYS